MSDDTRRWLNASKTYYQVLGFAEAPSDFMRLCKGLSYINERLHGERDNKYGVFVCSYEEAKTVMDNHRFQLAVGFDWSILELKAALWGLDEAIGVDRDGEHFLIDCHIAIQSLDHPDDYRYRDSPQPCKNKIHAWRDKWLMLMPCLNRAR